MKIAVLVGTRPELIKMAPVLRRLGQQSLPFILIHSNQHYSKEMDLEVIRDLRLRKADYNLEVGAGTHAIQTGKIMERLEKICLKEKPEMLIVHGDTNTALAGALTAKKMQIKVAHVEAGLRSFDYRMPEEINRILIDRISDLLFVPTEGSRINLLREGINEKQIIVTGNTIVDAVYQHLPLVKNSKILANLRLKKDGYILATVHRPETVDEKIRLKSLIKLLEFVIKKTSLKIVFPIHPRTKKQLEKHKLKLPEHVIPTKPLGYIDLLALLSDAKMILTDSGGIQEEAYILKKPLITLRSSTERPETLSANFIVDLDIKKTNQAIESFKEGSVKWGNNVFGKGRASLIITKRLKEFLNYD